MSTTLGAIKAERRTTQPGTARKPAARKRLSPQPSNFEGTLSHHAALPGPPSMTSMSLRRNDSSTAFLSHWLTCQELSPCRSATCASPRSSRSSAGLDRLAHRPLGRGPDIVARLEGIIDRLGESGIGHAETPGWLAAVFRGKGGASQAARRGDRRVARSRVAPHNRLSRALTCELTAGREPHDAARRASGRPKRGSDAESDRPRHSDRPRAPQGRGPRARAQILLRGARLRADAAPQRRRLPPRPAATITTSASTPGRAAAARRWRPARPASITSPSFYPTRAKLADALRRPIEANHLPRRRERPWRERGPLPARPGR